MNVIFQAEFYEDGPAILRRATVFIKTTFPRSPRNAARIVTLDRFQSVRTFLLTATTRSQATYYSKKELRNNDWSSQTPMMTKVYNNLKTVFLLSLMTGLILFVGSFFGSA